MYTVFTDIALDFDVKKIMNKLHIPDDMEESFAEIAEQAKKIAKPRALYRICTVENKEQDDNVYLDGIAFPGEILKTNLEKLNRAFLYMVTEGPEMEEWGKGFDFLEMFFVCELRQSVINNLTEFLADKIKEEFKIKTTSSINPCALDIWTPEQQGKFYEFFSDASKEICVEIQPNLLLSPQYSMSGILFQSDTEQHNCSFCPNPKCPNRKSAYIGNKK